MPGQGEIEMKALIVVLSALLMLAVAALHAYRAYAGWALVIGPFSAPIGASWICAGVLTVLALLLLIVARK